MKFLETLASYIPSIIVDELQSQIESGGLKKAPYRTEFDTVNEVVGLIHLT
jgi:hypothetical protein